MKEVFTPRMRHVNWRAAFAIAYARITRNVPANFSPCVVVFVCGVKTKKQEGLTGRKMEGAEVDNDAGCCDRTTQSRSDDTYKTSSEGVRVRIQFAVELQIMLSNKTTKH